MYGFELRHAMDEELSHRKVLLGGACVSFGLELGKDVTTCIVGTDGGAVLKCNTYCSERMAEEYRESVAEGADVDTQFVVTLLGVEIAAAMEESAIQ